MKRNWMQIVTLALCAVLFCMVIELSARLNSFQRGIENELDDLTRHVEHTADRLVNSMDARFEEAERLVADFELEPTGIDSENRALEVNIRAQLKEWREDTQLTLLADIEGERTSLPMADKDDGSFSAAYSLPLEGNAETEVLLDMLISGGGVTKQETIGGWGMISMLLPLRNGGGGWSLPFYEEGIMQGQFNFAVEGRTETPEGISNPAFDIYKNGELVETINAVEDPYSSSSNGICYTTNTENYEWQLKCEMGDVIDIRFRCVDEFGLGYDFQFVTWRAGGLEEENQMGVEPMVDADDLVLYWPE